MNSTRTWRFSDGVLATALSALAVFAAIDVWKSIFETGVKNPEQSHVLIAPLVMFILVWVRRVRVRTCVPSWSWVGLPVVLAGWGLSVFGDRSGIELAWHVGAIAMVFGGVVSVLGPAVMLRFMPAIAASAFLLPVPGRLRHVIAMPLQETSAKITQWLLDVAGFGVLREGSVLKINGAEVAIAEACNGMRMVSSLMLVTFAFVFSVPMRTGVRVALLALSPLIALIVNVIRLAPTVLCYGYLSKPTAELVHDVSGWAALLVALLVLERMLWLLRWLEVPVAPYVARDQDD